MLEGEQKYVRWSNLVNSEVNLVFTESNHGKYMMLETLKSHSYESALLVSISSLQHYEFLH